MSVTPFDKLSTMSRTHRLALSQGLIGDPVERSVPRGTSFDWIGFVDWLGFNDTEAIAVQITTQGHLRSRISKVIDDAQLSGRAELWVMGPSRRLLFHGWTGAALHTVELHWLRRDGTWCTTEEETPADVILEMLGSIATEGLAAVNGLGGQRRTR